jgi:hypothetical protein
MSGRLFAIAVAAAAVASGAYAEPTKPTVRTGEQAAEVQQRVVVASADASKSPASITEAQAPAEQKPVRKARVSTCRCGVPAATEN